MQRKMIIRNATRGLWLIILVLLASWESQAQQEIGALQRTPQSKEALLYKLTSAQAGYLADNAISFNDTAFFSSFVKAVRTDDDIKGLPYGHYLKVAASGPSLIYEHVQVSPFILYIPEVNIDLFIQLRDKKSNIALDNAVVVIDGCTIPYDNATEGYHAPVAEFKRLVDVTYRAEHYYYHIEKSYTSVHLRKANRSRNRSAIIKIPIFIGRIPVDGFKSIKSGHALGSINDISNTVVPWYNSIVRKILKATGKWPTSDQAEVLHDGFRDYVFFNKPKYRMNDTVSFKVLLLNNSKRKWEKTPLTARLLVKDEMYYLGTCTPGNITGYYYSFRLYDSMKVKPDQRYRIELIDKDSVPYTTFSFQVEEYELQKSVFNIECKSKEHVKGKPFEIKVTAKDENGLPMRDTKAEVEVTAQGITSIHGDRLFVPDELWRSEFAVEDGTKTIVIPDSIFAHADYNYYIKTVLHNAENERKEDLFSIKYLQEKLEIRDEIIGDSIIITAYQNDSAIIRTVNLKAKDRFGFYLSNENVQLPHARKINTHVAAYSITSDELDTEIDMNEKNSRFSCIISRTADSVLIMVSNRLHLPFTYQVFQSNKEVFRGHSYKLDTVFAANKRDVYYVALQYIWAGEMKSDLHSTTLYDKQVILEVDQPQLIYPGKETEITITAKDYKGKPVENMSILSYAYTSKFEEEESQQLPDFSSRQRRKDPLDDFQEDADFTQVQKTNLNYNFWKEHMMLDTIPAFRFIFPSDKIERIETPAADSITQFAPFVTDSGKLQGVHYVLVNRVPVYFGFTDQKASYSFETTRDYNEIRIRTKKNLVIIDSFAAKAFCKNMFTVDLHKKMKHVTVLPMPDTLTGQEINDYSNYIIGLNETGTQSGLRYISSPYRRGVYILLNRVPKYYSYSNRNTLGPVFNVESQYNIPGEYKIDFEAEHGFTYTFKPKAVKMIHIGQDEKLINASADCKVPRLDDWVITAKKMEDVFTEIHKQTRRTISYLSKESGDAQLQIELPALAKDSIGRDIQPLNIILLRPDNANFINIYPGGVRYFGNLPAGTYELLIVEQNGICKDVSNLKLQAKGINFYRINNSDTLRSTKIKTLDSFINKMYSSQEICFENRASLIMGNYIGAVYDGHTHTVTGIIMNENNESIPGASITIQGTNMGTVSDIDGKFSIDIPSQLLHKGRFIIKSLGDGTAEVPILDSNIYILHGASNNELSSVSVYGQMVNSNYTAEVTMAQRTYNNALKALEGSAPGVNLSSGNGQPGSAPDILIRGFGSLSASSSPLIVVNGAVYDGNLGSLNPSLIATMNVLKDANATAIYGARGANGVIMITTLKNADLPDHIRKALENTEPLITQDIMVSGLRNWFKDDAFWQPNLITDKNGKVSFKVKFPDDLTSWNTFVYAVDDKMHAGQVFGNIKSFKPVSASLQVTQFLVAGDSANFIGKSVNYVPDTIAVTNSYFINDSLQKETQVKLTKYNNEIIPIVAGKADSVKLKYLLTKADGYFDGEEKTIEIMSRGVSVAKGEFLSLDGKDTTINIPPVNNSEPLYMSATASLIDIVLDEIEKVKSYKHLCNEQLSSKIIATLNLQRIYETMKRPLPLNHKADVQKMVNLLLQRQNSSQLWGWWGDGQSVIWISQHVIRALNFARDMKYNIGQLNFEHLVQPLVYQLERDTSLTDIQSLKLLHTANMKIDYEKYIKRIERKKALSLGQKLELIRFRQELKLPYNTKLITDFKQEDIYGNIFWKDTVQYIYDNEILSTLSAFKILQADTSIKINKNKVVNWFIQQRKVDGWRNIYESSQLIDAITSNIDLTDTISLKPVLDLTGGLVKRITTFPYQEKVVNHQAITVHKTGTAPVYFTWYQRQWDTANTNLGANFIINATFEYRSKVVDKLKAGEAVQLKVNVKVEKSADFVMIDIPIPAGCSYNNKSRGYYGNEVHREYYKDRVSIFCEKLPKGEYTYTIDLLPCYTGTYTVNPAKAELMYFPVFYGREKIKRMEIE